MQIGGVDAANGGFLFRTKIENMTFSNFGYLMFKIMEHGGDILFIAAHHYDA